MDTIIEQAGAIRTRNLKEELALVRIRNDWSQEAMRKEMWKFSRLLRVSIATIRGWEQGARGIHSLRRDALMEFIAKFGKEKK